ncbi:MAG: Na+/H+ antiporter NhaA [Armatimonadetes bacterium]|nr:Na+/H+ antiporter NhaA [Armatimonadota bacterium]
MRKTPIERVLRPFQEFAEREASGGIVLLASAVLALVWANTSFAPSYFSLWETELRLTVGSWKLQKSLLHFINDGLMAMFFFIIGLEIKREILVGELSSLKQAALPLVAAVGGMVVPALLYFAFARNTPGVSGWGIPMATDIAFALGILALAGKRVPSSLKVFLAALAIVDDIGAVLVIALFYTSSLDMGYLLWASGALALMVAANALGVRSILIYTVLGLFLWYFVLKSGIHATIAGVLAAFTLPAKSVIGESRFSLRLGELMDDFSEAGRVFQQRMLDERQESIISAIERQCERISNPVQKLIRVLHPWSAFLIMPVFAFANSGLEVPLGQLSEALRYEVTLGVLVGLVVGKPLGILAFSWLSVKSGLAAAPRGVTWPQISAVGLIAGIGFTMSLFITSLAFEGSLLASEAKLGVLMASVIAGSSGLIALRLATRRHPAELMEAAN